MDDRIRDRRRSVSRQRGRRRSGLVLIAVLVLAAAGAFLWLRSSDVFAVKQVTATVTQCVSKEDIAQAASPAVGESLLRLSTQEIEQALMALPYVRSAKVYREFPNTLQVSLDEYEPVARLKGSGDALWLIGDDGRVLEKAKAPRGVSLPLIISVASTEPVVGKSVSGSVADALSLVALLETEEVVAALPEVRQIEVSSSGGLTLRLERDMELRLGQATRLEDKLRVAAVMMKQYLSHDDQIEYMDVSVPERVAVKAK